MLPLHIQSKEVEKYITFISKKSKISENNIYYALSLLPITIFSKKHYQKFISQARKLINKIDKKDVNILALYLKIDSYLWSQDKDFEKVDYPIKILKTKDLI